MLQQQHLPAQRWVNMRMNRVNSVSHTNTAVALAWSLVNTRKVYSSTSGAKPGQSASPEAMTPATKVPWPSPSSSVGSCVQLERSLPTQAICQKP